VNPDKYKKKKKGGIKYIKKKKDQKKSKENKCITKNYFKNLLEFILALIF
jgi:hypothetical protein